MCNPENEGCVLLDAFYIILVGDLKYFSFSNCELQTATAQIIKQCHILYMYLLGFNWFNRQFFRSLYLTLFGFQYLYGCFLDIGAKDFFPPRCFHNSTHLIAFIVCMEKTKQKKTTAKKKKSHGRHHIEFIQIAQDSWIFWY